MAVFRKNNAWWIDYTYQGRRCRQRISSVKRKAEEALSQVKVQIAAGTFVPVGERQPQENKPGRILFTTFATDEFLPWSNAQHSESHYIRLESIVRTHLHSYFSGDTLEDTVRLAHSAGITVKYVSPCYDVDTKDDLERLRRDLKSSAHALRAPETTSTLRSIFGS